MKEKVMELYLSSPLYLHGVVQLRKQESVSASKSTSATCLIILGPVDLQNVHGGGRVKLPVREPDHSPPSTDEGKSDGVIPQFPPMSSWRGAS
jgi:hypothetical protein